MRHAGKAHEVLEIEFVGLVRAGVPNVGEPLQLRRDVGEALELGGSERAGVGGEACGHGGGHRRLRRGFLRSSGDGTGVPYRGVELCITYVMQGQS